MTVVERIVALCCRFPWAVIAACLLLGGAAAWYTSQNFAMNTDSEQLIDAKVGWRMRQARFDADFPQQSNISRTACCGTQRRSASWMGRSERVIGIKTVVQHGIRENSGTCDGLWDSMHSKVEDGIWDASLVEERDMASHQSAVMKSLQHLFHQGPVTGLDDGQLLERFVARHDEAAFAALVALHGPLVLGVCSRILRDEHDIEDAFQATFLVLVRRAGSIRDAGRLGPWLHGVARRVAVRARSEAARRQACHRHLIRAVEDVAVRPGRQTELDDLRGIIDEEVARLPARYRDAVVLCDLEGPLVRRGGEPAPLPTRYRPEPAGTRPGAAAIPSDPARTGADRSGVVPDRGDLGGCAGDIGQGDRPGGGRPGGWQNGGGRSGFDDGRRAREFRDE